MEHQDGRRFQLVGVLHAAPQCQQQRRRVLTELPIDRQPARPLSTASHRAQPLRNADRACSLLSHVRAPVLHMLHAFKSMPIYINICLSRACTSRPRVDIDSIIKHKRRNGDYTIICMCACVCAGNRIPLKNAFSQIHRAHEVCNLHERAAHAVLFERHHDSLFGRRLVCYGVG